MKIKTKNTEIFNSFVNHEIKSALASTKAYSELLGRVLSKSPKNKVNEYTEKLQQQLEKVIYLFSTAMDAHRVSQTDITLHKEVISLKNVLEEVIQNKKNIFLQEFSDQEILVDPILLKKVLFILVDNAEKYAKKNSKITIYVEKLDNKNVCITIKDYGKGIKKEDMDKIFTPFFRTADSTGLGLGLFIAKEIISYHKGKLQLEETTTKGSTFSLTLPIS